MKNKLLLFAVCQLFYFDTFSQDNSCDSCFFYSTIFKDSCHFCKSTYYDKNCFNYLEKYCLKIGESEDQIINLLGPNYVDTIYRYRRDQNAVIPKDFSLEFDYYIPYYVYLGCHDACEINCFP